MWNNTKKCDIVTRLSQSSLSISYSISVSIIFFLFLVLFFFLILFIEFPQVRKIKVKNLHLRSKNIDKYAVASYNIYIIKTKCLIKSNERRAPVGETEEEIGRRKRTARTETNQIPNL